MLISLFILLIVLLSGCLDDCPLKKFVQLTKRNVPFNWEKECRAVWNTGIEVIGRFGLFLVSFVVAKLLQSDSVA